MILKKQNFKGITLCLIIALPIWFVVQYFRALEIIGAPVIGMLIGMTLSIIIKNKAIYAQGINFVSKKILQYAVILLGFGLNLGTIAKVGLVSLPIIISTILSSLITAFLIHKLIKVPDENNNKKEEQAVTEEVNEPDLFQIRSICELSTLECYYHNVAKSTKTKGSGLSHIGEKERTFWIEYTGVAKIGIDMSKVKMTVDGTNVTITIPNAKLINYKVESISKDNYIYSADSWFNRNPISGEEQTKAVDEAQEEMRSSVESNTSLLVRAQERAKVLIENYITRLGKATGVTYHIEWEYSDEKTNTTENDKSSK